MYASMDSSFDIFEIYRRYCDITSGSPIKGYENGSYASQALSELQTIIEINNQKKGFSVFEEIYKLMLRLDLRPGFPEFPRFYDFVFFVCRENGQIRISVSRAVMAWRLVLAGNFSLLNPWCEFVETNHPHNITNDTWNQVLRFSRCVNYNLQGYDPDGAWPVLIDDFVEHMYRVNKTYLEEPKRKYCENSENEFETSEECLNWDPMTFSKRAKTNNNYCRSPPDGYMEFTKLPCAVEICLSNSFAGILSDRPCLQFN